MTTRRQVLGAAAAVGAAWVAPEIMTAKPAGGATLSFPATAAPPVAEVPAAKTGPPLAFTGDNTEQDAGVGAALIAAGWAIHHWSARIPDRPTPPARP